MPSPDGRKAGLFAHVGPDAPGGVILSGHTDVVPVEGQSWSTDPFTVIESDDRLYGRGTADMKGFDALALAALPLALRAGLRRPLQIALSYDEEIGCTGAPDTTRPTRWPSRRVQTRHPSIRPSIAKTRPVRTCPSSRVTSGARVRHATVDPSAMNGDRWSPTLATPPRHSPRTLLE